VIEPEDLSLLTAERLRALLGLASDGAEAASLPAQAASRSECQRGLSEALGLRPAAELLAAVCSPDSPLAELQRIKDLTKRAFADVDAARGPLMILHHAAIAAAYGRHGRRISSRPLAALVDLYEDLADALDADPLAVPFRSAVERYRVAEPVDAP
jgi:hypothetical protein